MKGRDGMNEQELWRRFSQSGRVEDYLRYRGLEVPLGGRNAVEREDAYGRDKTASHDRGPDRT